MGVVKITRTISTFLGPGHIFGADEAGHFKLGLQIERTELLLLHMLKFCSMGVHSGSRDLLKFWEISANISETVQDKHIVTMED